MAKRGAIVQTDDEDQIRSIQLVGRIYTDVVIDHLAKLKGIRVIDVRGALITPAGVARMRRLMPETQIKSTSDEGDSGGF
ncbi:MAG: hypothetical protein EXS05_19690 [Planctomycetaceae bacterium]|nr:hypothetical protein [Planctomycetaceae bacterium]